MKKIMRKRNIICAGFTLIIGLILFYIFLPPLNVQSISFWVYVSMLLIIYTFLSGMFCFDEKGRMIKMGKSTEITFLSVFAIIGLILVINIFLSPMFISKKYANRIKIDENADFVTDVAQVNFNQLPLLDKDSSSKLGDRVMGQMPEMVSQYYVSDLYTQINYNDNIVRVTPLEYNGIFKYFKNSKKGVTGYITVNSVTGESKLVKVDDGMKYMPSSYFFKNLERHLRLNYPTLIFGQENFELDNDGKPYWVVPVMKYNGIGIRREVKGVVILDPVTGESELYDIEDVPSWVDHVYDADLIIEEVDDWGIYKEGFLNSIFSQTNVVMTTEGYNYTVMNDDVYLYTGITSVSSDEANIGFILTNMRTKETKYYATPGAEEYSAMASAEGQVQQMKYKSTFPLLINLNNKPTYLMSLKDNAGLVKMYAFVDVHDYQKVVVTDASEGIEKAAQNYLGDSIIDVNDESNNKVIVIKRINAVNIDGNTYYYIEDTESKRYKVSIKVNKDKLPFIKEGDNLKVFFNEEKEVTDVKKVEF